MVHNPLAMILLTLAKPKAKFWRPRREARP
jgi:hypothetical protein